MLFQINLNREIQDSSLPHASPPPEEEEPEPDVMLDDGVHVFVVEAVPEACQAIDWICIVTQASTKSGPERSVRWNHGVCGLPALRGHHKPLRTSRRFRPKRTAADTPLRAFIPTQGAVKFQEVNRLHRLIELASPVRAANPTDAFLEHCRVEIGMLHAEESVRYADLGDFGRTFNQRVVVETEHHQDRKSTRLNSSHSAKSRMPSSA